MLVLIKNFVSNLGEGRVSVAGWRVTLNKDNKKEIRPTARHTGDLGRLIRNREEFEGV